MNLNRIIKTLSELYPESSVPLHKTSFTREDAQYLEGVLLHGDIATPGKESLVFEEKLSAFTGAPAAVLNSGTSALTLALRLIGVQPGDEVITQALTFVATPNAIVHAGGVPIFLDVDAHTMGLSAAAVKQFLEQYGERRPEGTFNKQTGRRIAAILPMHTFGFMCEMDELNAIGDHYQLPLVEDAAEAFGSKYKGRMAGRIGRVGVYSFNGNKVLTTGGGGALVSEDLNLIQRAKQLSATAKVDHPYEYRHTEVAYNTRMPAWNAALGNLQMDRIAQTLQRKAETHQFITHQAAEWEVEVIQPPVHTTWNYWLTTVKTNSLAERNALVEGLNEAGFNARPIWNLMYTLPMYQHCYRDSMVNSEQLFSKVVCLPSSPR